MTSNSEVIGGIDTRILYGVESTYGTAVATATMFGGLVQSAPFSVNRQVVEHAGFAGTGTADGRVTAKFTTQTVDVRGSVEFKVQNFQWLQYVLLGTRTGNGTVAVPWVYPLGKNTQSITISENIDNVGTDSARTYAGMVVDSCSIRCAVGEPVSASLAFRGGKIAKGTSISAAVAQSTEDLYNFSGGTIEMPDATSIGNVIDSVEITISNSYNILYGFNQEAVNAKPGRLTMGVRFTLKYLDDDQMDRLMGSSTAITSQTPVTLAIKFTKGSNLYTDFVFTNVVINKIDDSHNLNEFMIEDVENIASTLIVTEAAS